LNINSDFQTLKDDKKFRSNTKKQSRYCNRAVEYTKLKSNMTFTFIDGNQ